VSNENIVLILRPIVVKSVHYQQLAGISMVEIGAYISFERLPETGCVYLIDLCINNVMQV
jgi:hypothetical protein